MTLKKSTFNYIIVFVFCASRMVCSQDLDKTPALSNKLLPVKQDTTIQFDSIYRFDRCNTFQINTYDSVGSLKQQLDYRIGYSSQDINFIIERLNDSHKFTTQTIIDVRNTLALQTFTYETGDHATVSVGKYFKPTASELRKLYLFATKESRMILGLNCTKYNFEYKNTKGEFWICKESTINNDLGIFRASKLQGVFNTLSQDGFVVEAKYTNERYITTVLKTTGLATPFQFEIKFKDFKINTLNIPVNYYIY
jgi:hypothetical protein